MAVEGHGLRLGFKDAAADLSAEQFKAVVYGAGGFALAGANAQADGILQNDPVADDPANVLYSGPSKAKAGAAFAEGALLATDAQGRLVTAASTNNVVARALEAASAADEIVTVLVKPLGVAP